MSELTQSYLKECLHYCPETGVFTWLKRPRDHFKTERYCKNWNVQFSGKVAGAPDKSKRTFYIRIGLNSKKYRAHRLAWLYQYGELPKNQIDHIDGDGTNNKISNLRDVTQSENQRNSRLPLNNTSGVKGVTWLKSRQKWVAHLQLNGRKKHLGCFDTVEDAEKARKDAELKLGYTHII